MVWGAVEWFEVMVTRGCCCRLLEADALILLHGCFACVSV